MSWRHGWRRPARALLKVLAIDMRAFQICEGVNCRISAPGGGVDCRVSGAKQCFSTPFSVSIFRKARGGGLCLTLFEARGVLNTYLAEKIKNGAERAVFVNFCGSLENVAQKLVKNRFWRLVSAIVFSENDVKNKPTESPRNWVKKFLRVQKIFWWGELENFENGGRGELLYKFKTEKYLEKHWCKVSQTAPKTPF